MTQPGLLPDGEISKEGAINMEAFFPDASILIPPWKMAEGQTGIFGGNVPWWIFLEAQMIGQEAVLRLRPYMTPLQAGCAMGEGSPSETRPASSQHFFLQPMQ